MYNKLTLFTFKKSFCIILTCLDWPIYKIRCLNEVGQDPTLLKNNLYFEERKQNVNWELKFYWQNEQKSTVGQNVILRHRFKMAANRKGIFLNTTININTYLVT
jgi:hypothetical protein